MKYLIKSFFFFTLLIDCSRVLGQDILILRTGEEIESKILDINGTGVKFKKYSNLEGPDYTFSKSQIFLIKYANGDRKVFNDDTIISVDETKVENKGVANIFLINRSTYGQGWIDKSSNKDVTIENSEGSRIDYNLMTNSALNIIAIAPTNMKVTCNRYFIYGAGWINGGKPEYLKIESDNTYYIQINGGFTDNVKILEKEPALKLLKKTLTIDKTL